jgi:MOSC domain-containing protein YiiM
LALSAGLRAIIVESGTVRPGDTICAVDESLVTESRTSDPLEVGC